MEQYLAESLARGASGPSMPLWLLIVALVVLVALAIYGISRKRKGH